MLLMLVTFIPMVSAQEELPSDTSSAKQVTIKLNQNDGVLIIPTEDRRIDDLSTSITEEKSATAYLSGSIDENNHVILEGVITLDGKEEKVQLSGDATHPSIWDIWEYNGYEPMNGAEAQDYLDDQGVYLTKGLETGSFYGTTNEIVSMIDSGRPFFLIEESEWGNCHAVVLSGYCYGPDIDAYFRLNDPNTWTGTSIMNWYDTDDPQFNYDKNVYEYRCADDTSSTGYFYLG